MKGEEEEGGDVSEDLQRAAALDKAMVTGK